jgi:hypothetical protein
MPVSLDEARELVWTLVRGIDRKAELSVVPATGDVPGVAATVTLRKQKTTLIINARDLENALANTMHRSQLRTTIKRAMDRMTFTALPVASTKRVRGTVVEGGFFRSQPGGFPRGGRR